MGPLITMEQRHLNQIFVIRKELASEAVNASCLKCLQTEQSKMLNKRFSLLKSM